MLSDTSLNPERCKPDFAAKPFMVQLSRQVNKFKISADGLLSFQFALLLYIKFVSLKKK